MTNTSKTALFRLKLRTERCTKAFHCSIHVFGIIQHEITKVVFNSIILNQLHKITSKIITCMRALDMFDAQKHCFYAVVRIQKVTYNIKIGCIIGSSPTIKGKVN